MSMRRAVVFAAWIYCVLLFLGVDFVYSTFLHEKDQWPRYPIRPYHHALVPRFVGYDTWGDFPTRSCPVRAQLAWAFAIARRAT